uniref:STEAP3 metalloreductase n=1 Tax=Oncorhynchus mykiss TaxID=8022 RepID=A0A8K9UFI5_ONCMY
MPKEEMERPLLLGGASPRHLKTSMSDPGTPLVGILGTGDFFQSLATRLVASGYRAVVGSRNPKRCASLFPAEAEVTTQADLVFMALFPEHSSTLAGLREPLVGKTLVDVSTGTKINRDKQSNAEQLANIFPESSVVKGFNVISAWSLQKGPRDGSRQVKGEAAHVNRDEAKTAADLEYSALGPTAVTANHPLYLFPSWRVPYLSTLGHFLLFYAYNFLPHSTKFRWRRFPNCLCLPMRRSARYNLLKAAFKQVRKASEDSWVEEEVWRMELYLSIGILALGLLSLLAISSLPTVGNSLNWREFSFVQSRLDYMALLMATLHTLTYGWGRGLDLEQYRFYLPPTFLLVLVLPLAVLLGRLTLSLPCVYNLNMMSLYKIYTFY